jgi:MFS family permease
VGDEVMPPGQSPGPPPTSFLARVRSHLLDLTPFRVSRDFRVLFLGQAVSDFGTEVTFVVVPYQVWTLTHSTLAVGLLGLCDLIPLLVTPVVGGMLADAFERRRLIVLVYAVLAVLSAALAANASLAEPHLWVLYAIATLNAALYGIYSPAVRTWPARLVPAELLPSVFSLEATFYSLDSLLGPAAAGVLIATIRPAGAYLVDVATFVAAIGALAAMRPSPPAEEAPPPGLSAIRDGLRFLRGKRVLQMTYAVDLNAMVFGMPLALLPAVADRLGVGPKGLGLLYAAPAGGSLVASIFSGRLKHVRRQGLAILLAVVGWGAAIAAFGLARSFWVAVFFLALAHVGDLVSGVYRTSIEQTVVSDEMRGRLSGIALTVWAVGPSLGNVEAGAIASLVSVPFAIVSGGVLCVAGAAAIAALVPSFARYDARAPHA